VAVLLMLFFIILSVAVTFFVMKQFCGSTQATSTVLLVDQPNASVQMSGGQ
jgi:hypothetical protein